MILTINEPTHATKQTASTIDHIITNSKMILVVNQGL